MAKRAVEDLRNLGPVSSGWLREVGISSEADLRKLGPTTVYQMVKQRQPNCSLNLLWALAAALEDIDFRELSPDAKQQLRAELNQE